MTELREMDTIEKREDFYINHECHPTPTGMGALIERSQWLQKANVQKPFQRVLDIGCHDGFVTRWLLYDATIHKVLGIDLCKDAIKWARQLAAETPFAGRSEYREQNYADLPDDELFDVVVAFELLEHLCEEDARALLRCMDKHLYPGGRAFLTTPEKHGGWGISNPDPSHILLFDQVMLRSMMVEEVGDHVMTDEQADLLLGHWTKR